MTFLIRIIHAFSIYCLMPILPRCQGWAGPLTSSGRRLVVGLSFDMYVHSILALHDACDPRPRCEMRKCLTPGPYS